MKRPKPNKQSTPSAPEGKQYTWNIYHIKGTPAALLGHVEAPDEETAPGFHLGPLGAGSDYVAFIDHLGVASLNVGFGGPNLNGQYHSIYDDPQWFEQFGDPLRYTPRSIGIP